MSFSINTRSLEPVTQSPTVLGETPAIATEQSSNNDVSTFETQLRAFLSAPEGGQVSEEELFAAVIQERLQTQKGDTVAEDFGLQFDKHKASLTRGDGYVNVEKAANLALADMVSVGHLSETEHDEIREQSFMAAQLDDNLTALYDGRGGAGDPTIAVSDLESALMAARTAITALENGQLPPNQLATDGELGADEILGDGEVVTPEGNSVDGSEGFVFKPESESDHKLVIILPKVMTGQVEDLLLKDENGNILERGRGTGVANGDREHFRFERAGGDYPQNLTVEVRLSTGESKEYQIPNPGERYD